jgi:mono/diheme cytochrome c family protein
MSSIVVTCLAVGALAAGSARGEVPLESAVAQAGRDYYLRYCASCHGYDARGDGPVAPALSAKPTDLTRMAERRKGEFPMDEIAKLIDGRDLPAAHGSREMPVWGERFGRYFEGDPAREQVIRGQVLMLLVYLQSIQK